MARLSIQSERVKHLVDTQVLPLFLAAGNVAALTKLLNDTLQGSGIPTHRLTLKQTTIVYKAFTYLRGMA